MENFSEVAFKRSYESLEGIHSSDLMSLISIKTLQAITFEGVKKSLESGAKLNVKFGTDPTGPDLHLGHIVPIRILDIFRRAGHNIDLIFGDFTAKIGDPTDRASDRSVLTDEQIKENMDTFRDQVDKYFNTRTDNVRVHQNSSWLGKMTLPEIFEYLQAINLTEATQRNDFRERMKNGRAVSLAETIYGTLMGIDSVLLNTNVEIGGVDQLLNFQQTRKVQSMKGQEAENIIMTPIIEGTSGDGRKMSKSYNNYIPVRADAEEIFGKIMSIPDSLVIPYIKAFAPVYDLDLPSIEASLVKNPLELKKQLAMYMASISTSRADSGREEREKFERKFAQKEVDVENAKRIEVGNGTNLVEALASSGDFKSKSEIRRLAEGNAIRIDKIQISVDDLMKTITEELIVTVGKRKVYKIALK